MKTSILFMAIAIIICAAGCKPADPPEYKVASGGGFFGRFYATRFTLQNETATGAATYAVFFNPGVGLTTSSDSATTVFVQNVACDGNNMTGLTKFTSPGPPFTEGYYQGSAENLADGIRWDVSGDNGIPFFSWTDNSLFPDYTGPVPNAVTKATGITFNFPASSVINADTVFIVMDNKGGAVRKGSRPPCSLTFTAQELSGWNAESASLNIILVHHTVKDFSGLSFAFFQSRAISKTVPVY
jgi:hypothetical protein